MKLLSTEIKEISTIGSGQIGPDIALFFADIGIRVDLIDISAGALERGKAKIEKKIARRVDAGRLRADKAKALQERIFFTGDYNRIGNADLVIEAATEEIAIKRKIFSRVESECRPESIILSNSSHLEPDTLFSGLEDPSRAAVAHFFYPAERNPIVEIVVGSKTHPLLERDLCALLELSGKLPLKVKPRYGYAVDPVFEGMCLAACQAVERNLGSIAEVDQVAKEIFRLKAGPFLAMNLVGAAPILQVGIPNYQKFVLPWFAPSKLLDSHLARGKSWTVPAKGEEIAVGEEKSRAIGEWLMGAVFMLACDVLDVDLIDISDYEDAISFALDMKTPFSLMNEIGIRQSHAIVERFAKTAAGAKVPASLKVQADRNSPWPMSSVHREDIDGVAVLTIRRLSALNALSGAVLEDLQRMVADAAGDSAVVALVIRGFGNRAFAAGADIAELSAIETPDAAQQQAQLGQRVFSEIENCPKPVIAAMNGLALGGGNELAMSCHARLAKEKQRVFVGQPEPKLGVIPGYGGTQRLPRLIGMRNAWAILRDANPISSKRAIELGLIRAEMPSDEILPRAIELARKVAEGSEKLQPIDSSPIEVPTDLPEIDIGPLSRKIDQILQDAVIRGARATLDEGLRIEAEAFGKCWSTEDHKIGMANFLKNGPAVAAKFKHR